ncbi:signal-regulatory protein beta-2-like [Varanus komodoensis]|uniref:signal-regulatory protein beta-2-like n=1 Tax=Varanus komodoensis TaxID=61221 RepID=UPI001CF7B529|nr:signal-regulatory protein beta-2-like [Varanus komodoensis]
MATSWTILGLPQLLVLLLKASGAVGQEVVQPQAVIEVQAGATLILGCSVMGATLRGPVKWFLGEGPARKLIYAEIGSFERVLRTNKDSNTDFSIAIQNVTQADAGTYYCVKQRFPWIKLLEHGPGTQVVVKAPAGFPAEEWFQSGDEPGGDLLPQPFIFVHPNRGRGQELTVVQPQDVVEVRAGATLILGCSVTGTTLPGPVKWFLGEGPARKLVYAEIGSFERVLRTDKASNTNFSIAIQNVTLEDAGTYYCVKQKKDLGGDKDVKTGPGTRVAVNRPEGFPSLAFWMGLFLSKIVVTSFLICLLQKKKP